ncbi:MAG TPA: hypothetical protein VHV78_10025, partial [Gemmatimonadaceae bacterium]|nr:hypothetical protein [Gemmatimonadaceae bacterium]
MINRFGTALVLAAVAVGVACVDMSAPKGPASISSLQLPSPSVVLGDMMRDSTGAPAPISLIAYDAKNNPITVSAQFFILDSAAAAHITSSNIIVGDKFGVVHVVGQIGLLQTPIVTVPVTVAPTNIAAASTVIDTLEVPITGDSATSIGITTVSVTMHGANDSTAQGFLVKFAIVKAPATKTGASSPAIYLTDDAGNLSTVDTTDVSGASRRLNVNSTLLADDSLAAGQKTDSVV